MTGGGIMSARGNTIQNRKLSLHVAARGFGGVAPMKIPTIGRIGAAILGFFLGIVFTVLFLLFVPKWLGGNSKDQVEEMRVTSPSGKLDAVMTRACLRGRRRRIRVAGILLC